MVLLSTQHSALGSLPHLFGHRAWFLLQKLEIEQRNGDQSQDRGADGAGHDEGVNLILLVAPFYLPKTSIRD